MPLLNNISKPGINVNTDSRLQKMALMRTLPISNPMPNCMNISAPKPEMVVKLLAEISGMALLKAVIVASLGSICTRSSL